MCDQVQKKWREETTRQLMELWHCSRSELGSTFRELLESAELEG
jgi:hypothetical protein